MTAVMAILAPAPQERARAREVLARLVRKPGEARGAGCSGPGEGPMSADFATVFGWLEAAESDNGPRGYLGDLLRFFAGDPGDGAAEEGRGRHSRGVHNGIGFDSCDESAAGGGAL